MGEAAEDDSLDDGGDVDEALDARLLQVQTSDDPQEWADLGADLCEQWRLEEAASCLQTAMRLGCDEAAFALGRALDLQDRLAESVQAYERAIAAGVVEAFVNQGAVWQQLGDLERARQRYQQAIEAGDLLGHIRLGQLLKKAGQVAQAQAHFRIAWKGGWPSASSALGVLLARQECWQDRAGPRRADGSGGSGRVAELHPPWATSCGTRTAT